jgi:tetratricopeptide (TPR) repeat protein
MIHAALGQPLLQMASHPGDADSAEQLDVADLDEEELQALAEVSKKGYYHGRPKSEAASPPQRLQDSPAAATTAVGAPCRRTEFDEFQRKWDTFGKSSGEDASEAAASRSSRTRFASESTSVVPVPETITPDPTVVEQLVSMGFGAEESHAAAMTCRNRVDAAVEHLLGRGPAGAATARTTAVAATVIGADPDKLAMLQDMGIPELRARAALEACGNDLERAVEQATRGVGNACAESLRKTRKILSELEADVTSVQGAATLNAKQLKGLAETVLQVSCSLDAIDVEGEPALRSERRAELDRCNVLDERISRLLTSADLSTETCSSAGPLTGEHCSVEQQPQESPTVFAAAEQSAEPLAASAKAVQKVASPIPDIGSHTSAAAAIVEPSAAAERLGEAERLRFAGNEAFKAGDFCTASKHYYGALELDGENVAILSNLAAAELKCGDFTSAAMHAAAANELSGGFSAKALFRQGQAMEGLGRPAEACEAYRRALEVEPGDRLVRQRLQECKAQL